MKDSKNGTQTLWLKDVERKGKRDLEGRRREGRTGKESEEGKGRERKV